MKNGAKNSLPGSDRYDVYRENGKETLLLALAAVSGSVILSVIFYDSIIVGIVASVPLFFPVRKLYRSMRRKKRIVTLKKDFLIAASLLGDYLKTGYSVENALAYSCGDLASYTGDRADIVREWENMAREMHMNKTAEEVFYDFGYRSNVKEIRDFSEIFGVVKRSGGQLSEIVRATTALLSEQFSVEEEIRSMTAAKRMEQKIMDVMPAAILLYMRVSSPELLGPLYTTAAGRLIMTVCLMAYGAAVWWAERIIDIRM